MNFVLHFCKLGESVSCLVSIEKSRVRQKFAETVAERAFTCGNSASDSDCGHELNLTATGCLRRDRDGMLVSSSLCERLKVVQSQQESVTKTGSFAMPQMRVSCIAYDAAGVGGKNRRGVCSGEQAQHRLCDREGVGRSRCSLDF